MFGNFDIHTNFIIFYFSGVDSVYTKPILPALTEPELQENQLTGIKTW